MTANQIANAANQIAQQQADERERNDRAVEDETKRHNLAIEGLNKEANEIEAKKAEETKRWNEEKLALEKWYQEEYLRWQEAQGKAKLEIEATLASIEERKAVNDEEYKKWMTVLGQQEQDLKLRQQDEVERVNQFTEDLRTRQLDLEDWKAFLTNKQIEYQNTYWNASILLGNLNATYNNLHNQQTYDLGMLGLERDLAKLKMDSARLEFDKYVNEEEQTRNWVLGIGNLVFGGLGKTAGLWMYGLPSVQLPSIGGQYGKKAQ